MKKWKVVFSRVEHHTAEREVEAANRKAAFAEAEKILNLEVDDDLGDDWDWINATESVAIIEEIKP